MDTAAWIELALESAAIVGVIFLFFELVGHALSRLARRAGARKPTLRSIIDSCRIVALVISVVVVVAYAGLASVLTVLTLSGILALAISLALQSTLTNVVAGVLLLRDRAIRYGDTITFGGVKGRVIRIALRNTWIVTETDQVVIIGNGNLLGGPLTNHTASQAFIAQYDDRPAPPPS